MNAEVKQMRTQAELAIAAAFAAHRDSLAGAKAERADAFKMFEQAGLPHRRVEEWKYTDLRALMREAPPLATKPDASALADAKDASRLAGVRTRRLVLVNGIFEPVLSDLADLEPGLSIASLHNALTAANHDLSALGNTVRNDNVVVALNTAFMNDGFIIHVAAGTEVKRPLHVVHVFAGREAAAIYTRSLCVVEKDAKVTVIESFEGPDAIAYQTNTAMEFRIGDNAEVDRVKIGREGDKALHLSSVMTLVGASAKVRDFALTTGGAVTRNQLFVQLDGEDTELTIAGGNLQRGAQHVDTTMVVDHTAVGCVARERFKSVLDDNARNVFQGKIVVRQAAQQTDAKMATNALLLSEDAEADNKPELEIFADDVQCGHGATAGALDEDLLFYLRARGIPLKEAEALMIQSFVGEAIETVASEPLREVLVGFAEDWLKARA